jgi:glycolate oxidase iron-sulfur subunit
MQTQFSSQQLQDPATATAEAVIRKCVHCGFCLATCPTYQLLGDELDSPRGRIYLMKDLLENERVPTATEVKHIDRCLSCLACMSTCPSDVHYMHLVDHARAYIERRFRRPFGERLLRGLLARVLPHPERLRRALRLSRVVRPATPLLAKVPLLRPLVPMLRLTPRRAAGRAFAVPSKGRGVNRGRVAILQGCVESVVKPQIRAATVRLLNRSGFDVLFASGEVCCGALVHQMGREQEALMAARSNVDAWSKELEGQGLDAIVVTASGCGTMIKDYGFLLRGDAAYAARAARISSLARDVTEMLADMIRPAGSSRGLVVTYHSACSLHHGQKLADLPQRLLRAAGFEVRTPLESHVCCGSAGTYNLLQPQIAAQLGVRKVAHLERTRPDVIATGNIGCLMQIGERTAVPVVHTVELLDWATGGPVPPALAHLDAARDSR